MRQFGFSIKVFICVCLLLLSSSGISSASVSVTSDSKYFDVYSGCFVLEGNVLVKTDDRSIGADKARVNLVSKEVWANGDVFVEDTRDNIKFKGAAVYASDASKTAVIKGNAHLERTDIDIHANNCSFNWQTKIAEFEGLVEVKQNGTVNVYDKLVYNVAENKIVSAN